MSLISSTIPNLINGISQQPPALRMSSQADEQINGYSSVVDGLSKRPGSKYLGHITDHSGDSSVFIHTINRDATERYIVIVTKDTIKVSDLQGNLQTVEIPEENTYFKSSDPARFLRGVTVADYTFLVNTEKVVQKSDKKSPARKTDALVWVKQGSYAGNYKVHIDGTNVASYTVPNGSDPSHATNVTTDYIAGKLYEGITSNLSSTFDVDRYGSTLWIRRKDGGDFTIRTEDSIGDTACLSFKDKVQRFSDLPAQAVDGFTIEIAGDSNSLSDNYYVTYEASGTHGVWKETVKPDEEIAIDASTLPHALVRRADGVFELQAIEWEERECGDSKSNPFPSFVGKQLNDVFFFRNRLGFLADENIIFSKAGDFFNFFKSTATATLDDDCIDVSVTNAKVSILRHAIPFNETLIIFSDQTQFQLGRSDLLTPRTISVNVTTEFECSLRAKPAGAGRNIYFAVNKGLNTGLREYYVDGESETNDAMEVTAHIPYYIPPNLFKMVVSGSENVLMALSEDRPNSVFVYKFHWANTEKVQASWSRWDFNSQDKILNVDFIESKLYMVVDRQNQLYLEVVDLASGAKEPGWPIPVNLDSRLTTDQVTYGEYDSESNTTSLKVPYRYTEGDDLEIEVVAASGGALRQGFSIPIVSMNTDPSNGHTLEVHLRGNCVGQPIVVGKRYNFLYRFSTLFIKETTQGGDQIAITDGRTQIRNMGLLYANSGFFTVVVTPHRREPYTYTFTGRVGNNLLGEIFVEDGRFKVPVVSRNDQVTIEIHNDTYLPSFFLSAEWEAYFKIRSRRV